MSEREQLVAGVIGATGHTGGEMCRLLLNHPHVAEIIPTARGEEQFERVHTNLLGSGLEFVGHDHLRQRAGDLDVVFFCTPSGEAMRHAPWYLERGVKVIDLSADFRFSEPELYQRVYGEQQASPDALAEAVYGVTELHREQIAAARLVANPGCYVITAILALTPLLRAGYADLDVPVHISAVNGTTGAGNKPVKAVMHAEAADTLLPYSMEGHRHGPELESQLSVQAGRALTVDFNTAHGGFPRGIQLQASLQARAKIRAKLTRADLLDLVKEFYRPQGVPEHFVRVIDFPKLGGLNSKEYDLYPHVSDVAGSNFCHIGLDYDAIRGIIKVLAVTDNLVKGAAGSAIQNLNVMFGFDESAGLRTYGL